MTSPEEIAEQAQLIEQSVEAVSFSDMTPSEQREFINSLTAVSTNISSLVVETRSLRMQLERTERSRIDYGRWLVVLVIFLVLLTAVLVYDLVIR